MRTILNILTGLLLLAFAFAFPVSAEPIIPMEANTNQAAFYSAQLAAQKLEVDKDLTTDRLNAEKDMAEKRYESTQRIMHDLAWNSWVLFAIAIFFFGYLRDKRRHETIRLMVEKATPLTPELLAALRQNRSPRPGYDQRGYLCWGVILTAVGGALLFIFKFAMGNIGGAGWTAGCIVLAVGVAYLVLWVIERTFSNNGQSK